MKQSLKLKYPSWVNDNEHGKYNLCMSDDLDSLLSCEFLTKIKGYQVKHFYDFKNIYSVPDDKKTICVDIAIEQGKTWDNHVVKINDYDLVNPLSANINAINGISQSNYYTKYAGSTLLQILSYYDVSLPKKKESLLILLAIDSAYLGHYNDDFKAIHRRYLEQLELNELIDVLDATNDVRAFWNVKDRYNINGKITVNENGYLKTDINLAALQGLFDVDLSLSEERFIKKYEFKSTGDHPANISKPNVFSFALTNKNRFKYTMNCSGVEG